MVYRRHYRTTKRVSDDVLRAFIVEHISNMTSKADREEAISYMISTVRDAGLYMPTRLGEAESVFERLGFHLRRERNGYGSILRTYVQLGKNNGQEGSEGAGAVREEDQGLDIEHDSKEA